MTGERGALGVPIIGDRDTLALGSTALSLTAETATSPKTAAAAIAVESAEAGLPRTVITIEAAAIER